MQNHSEFHFSVGGTTHRISPIGAADDVCRTASPSRLFELVCSQEDDTRHCNTRVTMRMGDWLLQNDIADRYVVVADDLLRAVTLVPVVVGDWLYIHSEPYGVVYFKVVGVRPPLPHSVDRRFMRLRLQALASADAPIHDHSIVLECADCAPSFIDDSDRRAVVEKYYEWCDAVKARTVATLSGGTTSKARVSEFLVDDTVAKSHYVLASNAPGHSDLGSATVEVFARCDADKLFTRVVDLHGQYSYVIHAIG